MQIRWQFAWMPVHGYFLGKMRKNISNCRLLKFYPAYWACKIRCPSIRVYTVMPLPANSCWLGIMIAFYFLKVICTYGILSYFTRDVTSCFLFYTPTPSACSGSSLKETRPCDHRWRRKSSFDRRHFIAQSFSLSPVPRFDTTEVLPKETKNDNLTSFFSFRDDPF